MVAPCSNEKKTSNSKKDESVIVISDDESDNLNQVTNSSVIVISDSDDTLTEICENAKNRSKTIIQKPQNAAHRYLKRKLEQEREVDNHKRIKYGDTSSKKLPNDCRTYPKETNNGCTASTSYFIQDKENATRSGIATERMYNGSTSVSGENSDSGQQNKTNLLNCPFCACKTGVKDILKHFLKAHICISYVQCTTCNMKFNNREDAIEHLSNPNHVIKCPFCLQRGIDIKLKVSLLCNHVLEHHKTIAKEFPTHCCLLFPDSCPWKHGKLKQYLKHYISQHHYKVTLSEVYICQKCHKDGLNCLTGLNHCAEEHLFHKDADIEVLKNKCENHSETLRYVCQAENVTSHATVSQSHTLSSVSQSTGILKNNIVKSKHRKATSNTCQSKKVVGYGASRKKSSTEIISNVSRSKRGKKRRDKTNVQQLPSTSSNVISQSTTTSDNFFENEQWSHMSPDCLKNLSKYKHIIFVDLDNWAKFFKLPYLVPANVFVWGFCGKKFNWTPSGSPLYCQLVEEKRLYFHPKCGGTANAADFALCVQAARLDIQLPTHIPFTVLSGDRGFSELQNQLSSSQREIHLIDPHGQEPNFLRALLHSIGES